MSRDTFFLSMALVVGLTLGTSIVVRVLLARAPDSLINLPHKDYLLAPERRDATIRRLQLFMGWLAVVIAFLFTWTMELTIRANLSGTGLDMPIFLVGLVAFIAANGILLFRLFRGLRPPLAAS